MKIQIEDNNPLTKKTEMLCLFISKQHTEEWISQVNVKLQKIIQQAIKEIKKDLEKIIILNTLEMIPAQRILLAGVGKKKEHKHDIRTAAGKIAKKVKEYEVKEFTIIIPQNFEDVTEVISQVVEGVKLSSYTFDRYKTKKEKYPDLTLLASRSPENLQALKETDIITEGVIFARNIANLPPNDCNPATLAKFARSIANKSNMKCKIFSKPELKRRGFGGITAVGQGSKNEPKLIVLEHRPKKDDKTIVIVGKAVTFDTGGISIKPSEKMDEMKFDKCGGCTVLGIMKAVSELGLPVNVVGIIPSVENMPGGESYRPGDIIKLYNGKTVEVLNTDAEGRLILADALSYGEKTYSPSAIIDFATLTGACIVALGNNIAGLVSNNKEFVDKMMSASQKTSEEVWQLPLNDDFMDMVKSEVADIKNMGIGRAAGTITAAAFLRNAIKDTPWIHIDIAGVAWTQTATKEKPYNPKGATGFGIRLVLKYLMNN